MKIAVMGLWHLGTVTAACLAKAGFDVIAYDRNQETIRQLENHQAPLFEPGLNELLQQHKMLFTTEAKELAHADIIWVAYDTPVDDEDNADINFVKNEISAVFPIVKENTLFLISSQLPVGSTSELQAQCNAQFPAKKISFAYSPENLRLGKAIEVFTQPDRIIVGTQNDHDKTRLQKVLEKFSDKLVWMSVESAEMTKHALNAFSRNVGGIY